MRTLPKGDAAHRARHLLRETLTQAAVADDQIADAELVVAELATNAELHGRGPLEIRIGTVVQKPLWCEIVDSDPNLGDVPTLLANLRATARDTLPTLDIPLIPEASRGLLIAHRLSNGRCYAYRTRLCTSTTLGKAVAFALPMAATPPIPRQLTLVEADHDAR
ncbi:hypothetical protein DP939_22235 [Spongiactinospora rosea]|uniref:Histidine kinase/HSP90-like ATPase domain-containing protein n=1 Tax=Spongiactinospora rosea TaxID=2248750 RepID=A0A366LXQ7_9ACTN|nr:ATP-binding protein [Spongiactinospora rosea]RBQ18084.1 hypothetical protein DP939_22235 [Spongiactinospora rosea]